MRVRVGNVVVKGESRCNLLGACIFLRFPVFCCVSGAESSPVASLSNVGLFGRLRLVFYLFCGWWIGHVVVRLICGMFWSGV